MQTACAPVYGGSALKPYTESLWYCIRSIVYSGTEGDGVVKVALKALQAVGRALGSDMNEVRKMCVCVCLHVCVCVFA